MPRKNNRDATAAALALTRGLDAPQTAALVRMIRGGTMSEAAAAAGVDRSTLFRWRTEDPRFIGALEAWRAEQKSSAHDRLTGLAGECTDVIARAIREGDARLALRVLERIGVARDVPNEVHVVAPVPLYDGFIVRCVAPGPSLQRLLEKVSSMFSVGLDEAAKVVGDGVQRNVGGPYELCKAQTVADDLREAGAIVEVVKVHVSYHAGRLPGEACGEMLPSDGSVVPADGASGAD